MTPLREDRRADDPFIRRRPASHGMVRPASGAEQHGRQAQT
jgi:hypothetical protein